VLRNNTTVYLEGIFYWRNKKYIHGRNKKLRLSYMYGMGYLLVKMENLERRKSKSMSGE
jgi:hypothetical protein